MSKVNEDQLPVGWTMALLTSLVGPDGIFCDGDWVESKDQDPSGDVRLIQLADVGDGDYRDRSDRFLTSAKAVELKCTFMQKGDLLIARMPDPLGRVCIFPGDSKPCVTVVDVCIVRPASAVSSRWLMHHLNSPQMRRRVAVLQSGTTRKRISRVNLGSIAFPIPPMPEQQRIAAKLDELLSDLDAGVAALERAQAKLKHYRAAVLKAAVEGALTAEWRGKHPATEPASALLARILAERRRRWEEAQLRKFKDAGKEPPKNWKAKYQEPVAPDTTNLPPLPQGWCWASLDQLANIAGGVTKGQKFSSHDKTRLVPYLRVANVQRGFLDLSEIKTILALESDITLLQLVPGDILFNEGGDRDKLGRGWIWEGKITECIHQNHVFRARLIDNAVAPKFVSWCGNSYGQRWFMQAGKQSVNLASINLTILRSFPVAIVPTTEQLTIVELVEDQLSIIDHLEGDIDAKLKSAQVLRQAILRQAFTGQLVPQDPNDEPAAELLKRIAAEREERAREARAAKKQSTAKHTTRKERT